MRSLPCVVLAPWCCPVLSESFSSASPSCPVSVFPRLPLPAWSLSFLGFPFPPGLCLSSASPSAWSVSFLGFPFRLVSVFPRLPLPTRSPSFLGFPFHLVSFLFPGCCWLPCFLHRLLYQLEVLPTLCFCLLNKCLFSLLMTACLLDVIE